MVIGVYLGSAWPRRGQDFSSRGTKSYQGGIPWGEDFYYGRGGGQSSGVTRRLVAPGQIKF